MAANLRIFIMLLAVILYFFVFLIYRKGRISFKYLVVWFFPITAIMFISILPLFLDFLTKLTGFKTVSNMMIGVLIAALIFITISLTVIISGQTTKIQLLIQEVSILKKRIEEVEKERG